MVPRFQPYLRPAAWAIGVFVLAFLLYANTLGHQFVWDDVQLIEENPRIHRLDIQGVNDAFSNHYLIAAQKRGSLYRPTAELVSALICAVGVFWFLTRTFGEG